MIHNIRAILADVDGTLVPKGENLMPLTREMIQEYHKQGVLFGIASGRPIDWRLLQRAKDWNLGFDFDVVIGMNGGDIWTKKDPEVKHLHLLQPDTLREIMSFMIQFDCNALTFVKGFDEIHGLKMNEFMVDSIKRNHSHVEIVDVDTLCSIPTGKLEIHYDPNDPQLEKDIMDAVRQHKDDKWVCVKTYMGTIEFQDSRVDKGNALEQFAKMYEIPVDQILAFGDMDNDLGMIQKAGIGVCLKNGCEACKQAADTITTNDVFHDGVGYYLQDLLRQGEE